jgi:hypothetical protein
MAALSFCLPLILAVSGLNPANAADEKNHAPHAKVPNTVVDLGKAEEGDVLAACFAIHNDGKGMLRVREVKSGCDCTHVKHPQTIAPDAQAEVCLSIDTLGIHGRHKFKTAVYCNDPSRPVIVLQVLAQIAPMVTLTPDRVFFKAMAGSDFVQEVRIATKGQRPLNVKLDSHDLGKKIAVDLEPVVAGKQYRLAVKNRILTAGSYRGRIFLRSDHPGRDRIVVPVFAHLTPPVGVYPFRLILDTDRCPACRAKSLRKGELIVRAHDRKPLQILSVGPEQPGLTWTITTLIPDEAYRLDVRYASTSGAPLPPPEMKIKINRTDQEALVVPLGLK